jgi:hypothetical protein
LSGNARRRPPGDSRHKQGGRRDGLQHGS